MHDAEQRLRLAAESFHREVLRTDVDQLVRLILSRAGIEVEAEPEDSAGDAVSRADRMPAVGPGTGGRRRHTDGTQPSSTVFHLELEELMHNSALHSDSQVLRRIAELVELLTGKQESHVWWQRAAATGDRLAVLTLEEWEQRP